MWAVVTPDEASAWPAHRLRCLHPLMGGIPPELGWSSLQTFVDKVQPRIQADIPASA